MNLSVLGCGRWGSFLGWYACRRRHGALLYGRDRSPTYEALKSRRANEYLQLPATLGLTSSLKEALDFADQIVISIPAQNLRDLGKKLAAHHLRGKTFILCMKGLEAPSGKRLSQVLGEELGSSAGIAVWVGPGHVQEFLKGVPNCMVVGSENIEVTKKIVGTFGSDLIRFYYGQDLIGNEIGAASKNVIGIAAGMLDGLGYGSLKGALMARGSREISRLVRAMGGNELTIYGLSHLGDYEATLCSPHSHNRKFGELWVAGKKFDKLAEGVSTLQGLRVLSSRHEVALPIVDALHAAIFEGKNPKEVLLGLFMRPTKFEF
ncbi:MAG: NAD(P)H-dependent glycerol-3-phosphate dehydrogenase [Deltaproteobacteria bacterium]|nr:MAG: NAD(P)H-dependent glycerol-3-phosphate dehydrogenase [Deltaproteobacteria bacterium]